MALVKVFVFVVLGVAQAVTKQEKIKPNYFSDSDSVFKYSSAFAFDPFTPFPELLSTTPTPKLLSTTPRPRPNSSTRRTEQSKSEITDTRNLNAETTTATITKITTKLPNKKVIILRKKKISKKPKKKSPQDLISKRGFNFTADGVSRQETLDKNGTVQGVYSYTDATGQVVTVRYSAGKNGYRVISDTIEKKQARIKSKTDTSKWVQSILSRTTKRPTTTTTTTTTPAPTPSTTTAPILTRELQLQLQKLLARRNLPEQSRSSSRQRYFKTQQFNDNKIQTKDKTSLQPSNFPSQQFPTQHRFTPQQQFTPQQKFTHQQQFALQHQFTSPQHVSASHQQPLQKTILDPLQLLDLQKNTAPRQKAVPEQKVIQPHESPEINGYKKAILSQQQSHQAFLEKNRFRLQAQNSQQQYSQDGQQQHFPNQISSPLQQQVYHGQLSQQQYYNTQQSEQQTHQQQFQLG